MTLKAGSIIKQVTLKNGVQATLRYPKWEDVDGLLAFISSLIDEGNLDIAIQSKPTRNEELDWHANQMAKIEKGEIIACVVEVDGKIVGNSSFRNYKLRITNYELRKRKSKLVFSLSRFLVFFNFSHTYMLCFV